MQRPNLADGDEVGPLVVLHTPGHTDGHLAFSYEGGAVIAVGDAVATWPRFGAGWPGFNLHEQQYRASLVRLVDRAPKAVGPGHGAPVVVDTGRRLRTLIRGRRFAKARARTRS